MPTNKSRLLIIWARIGSFYCTDGSDCTWQLYLESYCYLHSAAIIQYSFILLVFVLGYGRFFFCRFIPCFSFGSPNYEDEQGSANDPVGITSNHLVVLYYMFRQWRTSASNGLFLCLWWMAHYAVDFSFIYLRFFFLFPRYASDMSWSQLCISSPTNHNIPFSVKEYLMCTMIS